MSINKLLALLATSVVTPAVIKLVAGLVGCNEPNVNCVILLKLPVGVVLVVIALIAAGLGVLSMVLWGVLPLFIVWLIWRLATGGAQDGEAP